MTQCGLEVMYQGRVHRPKAVGQHSSTIWIRLGAASVAMGFHSSLPPSKADDLRVEDRHHRDHFIYLTGHMGSGRLGLVRSGMVALLHGHCFWCFYLRDQHQIDV